MGAGEVNPSGVYPEGFADTTVNEIRALENAPEIFGQFLLLNLSRGAIENIILADIVHLQVLDSWPLFDAIFNYEPDANEAARLAAIPSEIEALQNQLAENPDSAEIQAQLSALEAEQEMIINGHITSFAAAIRRFV